MKKTQEVIKNKSSTPKTKSKPSPISTLKDFSPERKKTSIPNLNSQRSKSKPPHNDNTKFQFTKKELEKRLQDAANVLSKSKPSSKSAAVPDLKNIFFSALKETQQMSNHYDRTETSSGGKELSSLLREAELQKKIRELENERSFYLQKINNHALYIVELEEKVNELIKEYERTLIMNQKLIGELEISKQETSIFVEEAKNHQNFATDIEELRKENIELKNELERAQRDILELNKILSHAELVQTQNKALAEELEKLKSLTIQNNKQKEELEMSYQLIEGLRRTNQSPSDKNGEKARFSNGNETELAQQEQRVIQKDVEKKESLKDMAPKEVLDSVSENFEKEIGDYQEQIKTLALELKKANEELDCCKLKCSNLEIEVSSKERLETLVRALREKIEPLERQAKSLIEENFKLQAHNENNLGNSENSKNKLPDQISESNLSTIVLSDMEGTKDANLPTDKKEVEEERANYKIQIERYVYKLVEAGNKVQSLIQVNEAMARDLNYIKYDFENYRTLVWSVYQEARRHLNNFRAYDFEIQNSLSNPTGDPVEKFNFLSNLYLQLRREVVCIDYMIEERRSFI